MTTFDQTAFTVELQRVLEECGLQEPRAYLFLGFTPDCEPFVAGEMPWSIANKGVTQFANQWALKQDIAAFEDMLSELQPDTMIDAVKTDYLDSGKGNRGSEDGARVAYRIIAILLKALLRMRRVKPCIRWEFPESPVQEAQETGICQWLFRR